MCHKQVSCSCDEKEVETALCCAELRVPFCGLPIVVSVKERLYSICSGDEVRGPEKSFEIGLLGPYVSRGILYKLVFVHDISFHPGKVLLICGITQRKIKSWNT